MKNQLIYASCLASACFLAGCANSSLTSWTESLGSGSKLYAQDEAVTMVKPFSVRIVRAHWSTEFGKPGYDAVPEGMRDQFTAKPSNAFLVIDLAIDNLDTKPANWRADQPPLFTLRDASGVEFAPVGQALNMDDLTGIIALGQQSTINPKSSLNGRKVFDVPKGDYFLDVALGRAAGGWSFTKGRKLWSWGLSPEE